MADPPPPTDNFVKLLTEFQSHLMGYIMASLGDHSDAADVLQQTNVVLLQKSHELRADEEFLAWATVVAKFKILSFIRDKQRDRLVFSPEVTEALTQASMGQVEEISDRRLALRECLAALPKSRLDVLQKYYTYNKTLKQIASEGESTIGAVKGFLKRTRKSLSECIDRRLALWAKHA